MAQADLIAELHRRAGETANSIRQSAREEAERIASDADRAIEERRSSVLRSREDEYRAEARASIAAARHEAMRAVLLAQTRLVERVLDSARGLVPALTRDEAYLSQLPTELKEAIAFVGSENATVRCSDGLEAPVREALRAMPRVSIETMNAGSGFVASGDGGSVRVDATLEARLSRLAPALAIEIHDRLEEV